MTCHLRQEIKSEWALKVIRSPDRLYDCSASKCPRKEKNDLSFVTWSSEVGKHRIGFRKLSSPFCHPKLVVLVEVCFDPQFFQLPPVSLAILDSFRLPLWSALHSLCPAFWWDRLSCVAFWLVFRCTHRGAWQESRGREERRCAYYFWVFFPLSSIQGHRPWQAALPTEPLCFWPLLPLPPPYLVWENNPVFLALTHCTISYVSLYQAHSLANHLLICP